MYENLVDILIYLYENYLDGDGPTPPDENELREELVEAVRTLLRSPNGKP